MIEIGRITRVAPALKRDGLTGAFNRVAPAYSRATVGRINLGKQARLPGNERPPAAAPQARPAAPRAPQSAAGPGTPPPAPSLPRPLSLPRLLHPVQKGQKTALGLPQGSRARLRVGFGWNVLDGRCDIDASAFLLGADGRVLSDDWFVFYGQPASPDGSVRFREDGVTEREVIDVDLGRLDPCIARIVFVMTINEAMERRLNFGMIQDAWLRVLDGSGNELVGYSPAELYDSITSMTLGELYLRKGEWRFNPVGDGMSTDLAGQCAIYGVNITD